MKRKMVWWLGALLVGGTVLGACGGTSGATPEDPTNPPGDPSPGPAADPATPPAADPVPAADCLPEGGRGAVVPGAPDCCPGLVHVSCAGAPDAEGRCEDCVGGFVCAACGDGLCGTGETACNCPADCR